MGINRSWSKNKIITVQKRSVIGGFHYSVTIPMSVFGLFLSLFLPTALVGLMLSGFTCYMDIPEGGGYVDSAEAMEGLTDTAGGDVIYVDSNADILVDNDESMPGLTATAGAVTLAGIGVAGPVVGSVINSYSIPAIS